MSKSMPDQAFILAAGKGTRLRPYTDTMPKPMVPIQGTPILGHTLQKLKTEEIKNVTININYLGDRIKNYTDRYDGLNITLSPEEDLLDTGGGVQNALHTLRNDPFFLINGDAFWTDHQDDTALQRLAKAWNPQEMDILLLLQPIDKMILTQGVGDYDLNKNGLAVRSLDKTGQYMFGGIRITHPAIFKDTSGDAFSFLELMDKAQEKGRLHGIVHEGDWHHISTPQDLDAVNHALSEASNLKAKSA